MDRKMAVRIWKQACAGKVEITDWPGPNDPDADNEPDDHFCWPCDLPEGEE